MNKPRILVSDDNADILTMIVRWLSRSGFQPDQAENGHSAMLLVQQNEYDLIITDIYMPGATGLDLLGYAKQRDPNIQVIVITGGATLDNAIEALNRGAFGYLVKPFEDISVFHNLVQRALEFRRLTLENIRLTEAHRMRGDLLEEEVTDRIRRLQQTQRDMVDLLNSLPVGVLILDSHGKVLARNPAAVHWIRQDATSTPDQPLQQYFDAVQRGFRESDTIQVGDCSLRLSVSELPVQGGDPRVLIAIQELENPYQALAGRISQPMEILKRGIVWLTNQKWNARQAKVIDLLAAQIRLLERLFDNLNQPGDLPFKASIPDRKPSTLESASESAPRTEKPMGWEVPSRSDELVGTNSSIGTPVSQSGLPWPPPLPSKSKKE